MGKNAYNTPRYLDHWLRLEINNFTSVKMKETRRRFTAVFKAKIAIEALQERKTLAEISTEFGVHPNMIKRWKQEFVSRASEIFETKAISNDHESEKENLYAKIGKLEMEKEWLKKISRKAGV